MKYFKKLVKEKISQAVRHQVNTQTSLPTPLFGDSYWYAGPNLWEPPVLLALKDLCRPGAVVFDVGGNMGGLSSAMARLVGPRGIVCAFEASPRIIGHLQANMVKQGHHNVTVYNRAVYSRSNETVLIYEGDHLNDSILAENSPTKHGHQVKTVALDDFCEATALFPEVIKMDIEGAEFDALKGSVRLIESAKPHLVLEQQTSDMRCFEFLVPRGYLGIDLNTYRQINAMADYPPGAMLRNVAFIHSEKIASTPYKQPVLTKDVAQIGFSEFMPNHLNGYTSREFELAAGRYVMDVEFSATGMANNMMCGVRFEGVDLFRYHAYSKLIAGSYRDWVVEVPRRGRVSIYFDFHNGSSDPSLKLRNVTIRKLEGCSVPAWANIAVD